MTSYTKALFERNPAAAKELRRDQLQAYRHGDLVYGRHVTLAQFTPKGHEKRQEAREQVERDWDALQKQAHQGGYASAGFGKRLSSGLQACERNCGQPACAQGCTLLGQRRE